MQLPVRFLPLALLLVLAGIAGRAADTPAPAGAAEATPPVEKRKPYAERLAEAGVKLTHGPAKVALGKVAELTIAEGEHAIAPESIALFFKLTENGLSGKEAGVVVADAGWTLFFDYDQVGYVNDDEKDKLDASALLKNKQESQEANNAERKEQGWTAMKIVSWAKPPYYDEKTHNLRWALTLASERDNFQSTWINEEIRLLGRGGFMNVTLVTGPDTFATHSAAIQGKLASNFNYVAGERYSEFKKGDKIAAYGLSALVLGGGVAVAAKMGWLAKLWKPIAVGLAAAVAGIAKLFRKISGRAEPPSGS